MIERELKQRQKGVCVCLSIRSVRSTALDYIERGLTSLHSQGISVKLQRCATVIFTAVGPPPLGCEIFTRFQMKISAVARPVFLFHRLDLFHVGCTQCLELLKCLVFTIDESNVINKGVKMSHQEVYLS